MPTSPLIGLTYSSAELDDFTLWPRMFHGVVVAGGIPIAIDCAGTPRGVDALIARLDGVLMSGGVDVDPSLYGADPRDPLIHRPSPERDRVEMDVFAASRRHGKPVLAICRGAQLVNVALGGTLHADLERDFGRELRHRDSAEALVSPAHAVDVMPGTLLAQWHTADGPIMVNSNHHQGVCRLAEPLSPAAVAPDGLIEGFEIATECVVGVQWHPEVSWPEDTSALRLLRSFVAACASRREPAGAERYDSGAPRVLRTKGE